jgi:Outer membrane protein beta-barrel domain
MEHFDDMLRNSLAGNASDSRFEFKEEYWLQAMALLELEEQKRKRRRALVYWSVLALLLIPAAICYYNRLHTHHNLPAPVQEHSMPSSNISNMADAKNNTQQAQNQLNTTTANAPTTTTETYKPTTVVSETPNPAVTLPQNLTNRQSYNLTNKQKNTNLKEASSNLALGSSNLEQTTTTQAIGLNNQAQITSNTTPTTNNPDNTLNPPSTVPEQTTVAYNRTSSPTAPLETTLPHFAFSTFDVLPTRTIAAIAGGQSTIPSLAKYDLPLSVDLPTPMTKVHKDQRFQWGITASLGTPSGLFIDEKPGIALGMTGRFRLSRKFSINTDLIWRRWKGNRNLNNYEYVSGISDAFVADLVSNQNSINYSFGYIATDITTSPKAFHLLELPVSLQYRIKKVALECGVDLSVRLVESIYQEQYQTTSLDDAQSLVKSGRSYQAYSKSDRFQTAILAGIHWQPSRKWSFGVRTYWNTNPTSNLNFQKSAGFSSNVLVISPTHAMTAEARVGYFF